MGGNCQTSPQAAFLEDTKYVSELSTILVATIQDAKDRISQIEYIFCSQIYPNFQSKSKSMQKLYSEAIEAAEASWKEKERDLLHQLAKLELEKQQFLDEIRSLKSERENYVDIGGYTKASICDLQEELSRKTKDVEQRKETQAYLGRVIDSKTTLIIEKEKSLKGLEEKNAQLLKREMSLEVEVERLKDELEKEQKLRDDLQRKAESLVEDLLKRNLFLDKLDNEKRLLEKKSEKLESDISVLLKETRVKTDEVEEGRKVQEQLLQQIELYNLERVKTGQEFEMLEKEKQQLLAKLKGMEEKALQLQTNLQERSTETSEEMELHKKLLQEIEAKNSQLLVERKKRLDLSNTYKKLKSQYNFLCSKYGLTTENMLPRIKTEDEMDSMGHNQSPNVSDGKGVSNDNDLHGHAEKGEGKDNRELLDDQPVEAIQKSKTPPPSSRSFIQPKSMANCKSCPPAGAKRPGSIWRDTRSHQSRFCPDLHDDFLDTPLEKIKADTSKATKAELNDLPDAPQDMDFDESDDETQDMKVVPGPQKKQMLPPNPGTSNYKYVEPVRKKAERENLKGIECKQCKKFYDAVLPNDDGQDQNAKQSLRCEHHDGVSRHRYRYAPPSTPEGFWNIGFESEM